MSELSKLPNIGKSIETQLVGAGIETIEQLRKTGSRDAWLRMRSLDPSTCIMRLYALEGATQGVRWHDLDDETKSALKEFFDKHKGADDRGKR